MTLVSKTRGELRQELANVLFSPEDYYIRAATAGNFAATPTTTGGTISAIPSVPYGAGHFLGGELVIRPGTSTAEVSRITAWSAAGVYTNSPAFSVAPATGDGYEIYLPRVSYNQLNQALHTALYEAMPVWPLDATDTTLLTDPGRSTYTAPTGWLSIRDIHLGDYYNTCEYFRGSNSQTFTDQAVYTATSNQKRAQPFQVTDQTFVDCVWLQLRTIGTITSQTTLTLTIETDSSGSPSGTRVDTPNGTATVTIASALSSEFNWVKFDFTDSPVLQTDTLYWLVLTANAQASGGSVRWRHDTAGQYWAGNSKVYGGSSWSEVTGIHFFYLSDTRTTYRKLRDRNWYPIKSSTKQFALKVTPESLYPMLLHGQKYQAVFSDDSTSCAIAPDWMLEKAASNYLTTYSQTVPDAAGRAKEHRDRAGELMLLRRPFIDGKALENF